MSAALVRLANPDTAIGHAGPCAPIHSDERIALADLPRFADAPPRLRASSSKPGVYIGEPRIAVDRSMCRTDIITAIYSEDGNPGEAQISLQAGGSWSVSLYSNPEQLREFAALLNETADLVEMVGRLEHDYDPDDGPHIVPDSAERLQDCTTNGIGAPR